MTINDSLDELRTILSRLREGGYYSNEDQADDAAHGLLILDEEIGAMFRKIDCHLEDARDILGGIRVPDETKPTPVLSISPHGSLADS